MPEAAGGLGGVTLNSPFSPLRGDSHSDIGGVSLAAAILSAASSACSFMEHAGIEALSSTFQERKLLADIALKTLGSLLPAS